MTQRPGGTPETTRRAADARRPGGGPRPRPGARHVGLGARAERPSLPLLGARRSTRRLAVLGVIFVMLGIMLVPTVRAYLEQRDQYAALTHRVQEQQRTVEELRADLERWKEPGFIETQARQRLTFVYPGETAYRVIDLGQVAPTLRPATGAARAETELTPYYAVLLDSLRTIDQGPTTSGTPASGATTSPTRP